MSYADRSDMALVRDLVTLAPREASGYLALSQAAERADGLIPAKYRELISIAVALTTQCGYCLDVHTKRAVAAGVTRPEIAEATFIAAALRAGAGAAHGLLALKLFDEHSPPGGAPATLGAQGVSASAIKPVGERKGQPWAAK